MTAPLAAAARGRGALSRAAAQQAQLQQPEALALLQTAAQMGRLGAWAFDVGRPRVLWSAEACAMHGMPPGSSPTLEEAIAMFAAEYRETMSERIGTCLATGKPFDVEGEIVTPRGERVWVRLLGEAQWDGRGVVTRLQGAIQDISEAKSMAERELRMAEELAAAFERRVGERTEQLATANSELEAFAYSIAHDLRAPLGSIDGFAKMLNASAPVLGERERHYLERIQAGVRQMAELTEGLLALAHLSRATVRIEPVDLAAVARGALQACHQDTPGREVAATVGAMPTAHGDAQLLALLMGNLVGNAWKFTSKNPDARIEVGAVEDCDHEAVYYVRDNGAGFDLAYAGKLFQPFHRMHSAADFEGMGIGLAIAHKVVTRHGGRVWAQSAPGEGAAFYFTLPGG